MLRNHNATKKSDPIVQEVELIHANPTYAHIKHKDGRETTASLKDLAPCPRPSSTKESSVEMAEAETTKELVEAGPTKELVEAGTTKELVEPVVAEDGQVEELEVLDEEDFQATTENNWTTPRRSKRRRKPPNRLNYS